MIYSVWDPARKVYDYYNAPSRQLDGAASAPRPGHLQPKALGVTPEQAAWRLPSAAQPIGSGKYPRGMIAERGGLSGLGILPFDLTGPNLVVLGVIGYFAWKGLKKR